jgi:transcriptional regulator with XRE-family HTH domain
MSTVREPTQQFENVGRALALLRELRGLSQTAVAGRARVSKGQLSRYENSRELPKLGALDRLLDVLVVRQDAFFSIVRVLDEMRGQLASAESLRAVMLVSSTRSFPPLDEAFSATFESILALQRSVLEALWSARP